MWCSTWSESLKMYVEMRAIELAFIPDQKSMMLSPCVNTFQNTLIHHFSINSRVGSFLCHPDINGLLGALASVQRKLTMSPFCDPGPCYWGPPRVGLQGPRAVGLCPLGCLYIFDGKFLVDREHEPGCAVPSANWNDVRFFIKKLVVWQHAVSLSGLFQILVSQNF